MTLQPTLNHPLVPDSSSGVKTSSAIPPPLTSSPALTTTGIHHGYSMHQYCDSPISILTLKECKGISWWYIHCFCVCYAETSNLCFLCDTLITVKFEPCGHSPLCQYCARRARKCPDCKVSLQAKCYLSILIFLFAFSFTRHRCKQLQNYIYNLILYWWVFSLVFHIQFGTYIYTHHIEVLIVIQSVLCMYVY